MRTVRLRQELLDRIGAAARSGYPDEACGFLFSEAAAADGASRTVSSVEAASNDFGGERRRRFVILPEELRRAEERAVRRSEVVSGFFHSHPDHPAIPSEFDTEHAWPWYSYLVVAVDAGGPRDVGAFELDAERRRFVRCELAVEPGPFPSAPGTAPSVAAPGRGG